MGHTSDQASTGNGKSERRTYGSAFDRVLAAFLWVVVFRFIFRVKVRGHENIPLEGPVLVVSNHPSYFEPMFIVAYALRFLPRTISFMAWDALFRVPVVRWACIRYGAFPVNLTNPGRRPFQNLVETLGSGGMAGVFPEGRRSRGPIMSPWKRGALVAARKTGAVILPASFVGLRSAWPKGCLWPRLFRRVEVVYHTPVPTRGNGREDEAALEARVRRAIEAPLEAAFDAAAQRVEASFQKVGGGGVGAAFLRQTLARTRVKW